MMQRFDEVQYMLRRESVVLKDLKDCSVYLLDYSGEVEVTNVQDSQIFIGEQSIPCTSLLGYT